MKRVFIVHGWSGHPEEGWFPWLRKELKEKGFEVFVPAMPDPDEPRIGVKDFKVLPEEVSDHSALLLEI